MGASDFFDRAKRSNYKNIKEAFNSIVEEARYEYGHGGYTGTIAEKSEFKNVPSRVIKNISGEDPITWNNVFMLETTDGSVTIGHHQV